MNPYSYQKTSTNWLKSLCSRRNLYKSKISWEFYKYSKGETEVLAEFWKAQEARGNKDIKIYELEQSIEIEKSARSSKLSQSIKIDEIEIEEVDQFQDKKITKQPATQMTDRNVFENHQQETE